MRDAVSFPVRSGASNDQQNACKFESASRRFDQNAGYALVFVVAVLLLIGILINPTLP
jgi:Tfp pilus assembly protein PilX